MKKKKLLSIVDLLDTYHECGDYFFKVVLSPKSFETAEHSTLEVIGPDGNLLPYTVKIWGRKMNCRFVINDDVPDGVCVVILTLKKNSGEIIEERFPFWVIK